MDNLIILLRFQKEYPDVPVLVCSSNSSLDYVERCANAGAKDYLLKPFTPEKLLEKVLRICSLPKQVQPEKIEPAPAQPEKPPAPPQPAPPKDTQTAYEQKLAGMTPDELLAEIERLTSAKVADYIARVLVVQKMGMMQSTIQKTLEENHFKVTGTAAEGWRCLEFYRETKPDLVIMDTLLADGIDGVKILQLIRKENPAAKVLMTGAPEERVMDACAQSGAKGFLAKPFKPEQLLEKARNALRN